MGLTSGKSSWTLNIVLASTRGSKETATNNIEIPENLARINLARKCVSLQGIHEETRCHPAVNQMHRYQREALDNWGYGMTWRNKEKELRWDDDISSVVEISHQWSIIRSAMLQDELPDTWDSRYWPTATCKVWLTLHSYWPFVKSRKSGRWKIWWGSS